MSYNPILPTSPPHLMVYMLRGNQKGKESKHVFTYHLVGCLVVSESSPTYVGYFAGVNPRRGSPSGEKGIASFLCTITTGIYPHSVLEMPLADLLLHPPLRFPTHTYIGPSHAFSSVSTVVCSRTNEALLAQGPNSY